MSPCAARQARGALTLLVLLVAICPASARARAHEDLLVRAQQRLVELQDGDGGFGRRDASLDAERRHAASWAEARRHCTENAVAALSLGTPDASTRQALQRAEAWLAARPLGPRRAPSPPALRSPLAPVRAALGRSASERGREAEDALLAALDRAFAERARAERAARAAPRLGKALGLVELEYCETLSRALPLLPPAHAARYRARLAAEAELALGEAGVVSSRARRGGVSALATARALLVLGRCRATG